MLWSLIKIVIFVALVAALTLGAGYLMESTGGVQVTLAGTEYTLGPLQSVLAAMALVVIVWLLFKLFSLLIAVLHFLNGDETALSRHFDRNRERKGYEALSEGLMALASGEGRVAMAKASKAERYLHKPELTDLITAQAAEMNGDRTKAEQAYKRLVQRDATRFVGVRGIMKQKLAQGDTDTALQLAERAFALKPKHEEVQDILLKLQAQKSDWVGARKTLNAKLKHGSMPRDVHKRRDAVLALSEAKDVLDSGKSIEAREAAIAANKASPDLIPAACMAARGFIAEGRPEECRPSAQEGLVGAAASRSCRRLCRDRAERDPGRAAQAVPAADLAPAGAPRDAAAAGRAQPRRRGFSRGPPRRGRPCRERARYPCSGASWPRSNGAKVHPMPSFAAGLPRR